MESILAAIGKPLIAVAVVGLKLYDGTINFAAAPIFFFWVKILPAVTAFLAILLILLIVVPFSYNKSEGPGKRNRKSKQNKRRTCRCCLRGQETESDSTSDEEPLDQDSGTIDRQHDKRRITFEEPDDSEVIVNKEAVTVTTLDFMEESSSVSTEFLFTATTSQQPVKPARYQAAKDEEENRYLTTNGCGEKEENISLTSGELSMDQRYKTDPVVEPELTNHQRPWYMGPGPGASDIGGSEISLDCDADDGRSVSTVTSQKFTAPESMLLRARSFQSPSLPAPESMLLRARSFQSPSLPAPESMQHRAYQSQRRPAPESMLSRTLKNNLSLRSNLSKFDFEAIDEFSETMERLKTLLKKDDAETLQRSMTRIEKIIGPLTSSTLEQENCVQLKGGDKDNKKETCVAMDNIISDLDDMLGDIDSWTDKESGC